METDKIHSSAELKYLPIMMHWIQSKIAQSGFGEHSFKIQLALEEGIINIIQHGKKKEPVDIKLTCRYEPNRYIEFDICDTGHPYNPLASYKPIDEKASLEEREVGGLGIPIIHKVMDSVVYRREEPYNILTLSKKQIS